MARGSAVEVCAIAALPGVNGEKVVVEGLPVVREKELILVAEWKMLGKPGNQCFFLPIKLTLKVSVVVV